MRLGIDLGGTKIAAVVLNDAGREVWRARTATPRGDYKSTIETIASLVNEAEDAVTERCSVGIGIPGAVSRQTGLIKNANSIWLIGRPFQSDLEARLAREVRLANDANCLVVSEASDGAAMGGRVVFGVILGTGAGGGLWVGGTLVEGANAIGGEWGHNPLPWPDPGESPGPPCYCGRSGCIEQWVSGPALARDYALNGGSAVAGEVIVARAAAGEPAAEDAMERWAARLARSLATIINVIDPDVIVVGGGLSRIPALYTRVPVLWQGWVFSDTVTTRLVPAQYGDDSGVRGAARLWDRK